MSEFCLNSKLFKGLNLSFITLNPKKDEARSMSDFRPISLIGGMYKILLKVLINRLSCILDRIISDNKLTFVGGHQIQDGIVILNKVVDEAKMRKLSRVFSSSILPKLMIPLIEDF